MFQIPGDIIKEITGIVGKELILPNLVNEYNSGVNAWTVGPSDELKIVIVITLFEWGDVFPIILWTELVFGHLHRYDRV